MGTNEARKRCFSCYTTRAKHPTHKCMWMRSKQIKHFKTISNKSPTFQDIVTPLFTAFSVQQPTSAFSRFSSNHIRLGFWKSLKAKWSSHKVRFSFHCKLCMYQNALLACEYLSVCLWMCAVWLLFTLVTKQSSVCSVYKTGDPARSRTAKQKTSQTSGGMGHEMASMTHEI